MDLTGHGGFTLLTGVGGGTWVEAAGKVAAELGVPVPAHTIGPGCEYADVLGDWATRREIGETGVLLVRPDHHIAWRVDALTADPAVDLERSLRAVLARP